MAITAADMSDFKFVLPRTKAARLAAGHIKKKKKHGRGVDKPATFAIIILCNLLGLALFVPELVGFSPVLVSRAPTFAAETVRFANFFVLVTARFAVASAALVMCIKFIIIFVVLNLIPNCQIRYKYNPDKI